MRQIRYRMVWQEDDGEVRRGDPVYADPALALDAAEWMSKEMGRLFWVECISMSWEEIVLLKGKRMSMGWVNA